MHGGRAEPEDKHHCRDLADQQVYRKMQHCHIPNPPHHKRLLIKTPRSFHSANNVPRILPFCILWDLSGSEILKYSIRSARAISV